MELEDKIKAFAELGDFLQREGAGQPGRGAVGEKFHSRFQELITASFYRNGWFTDGNVRTALLAIGDSLRKENIEKWLSAYPSLHHPSSIAHHPSVVGVIMAGNIPVVGFHDFMAVLFSGHCFKGKLSSDDKLLLPAIAEVHTAIEPRFRPFIIFTENKLDGIDAVIATGSNNSSRYFDYYFSKYPHIIRKNRNSVAVLNGNESESELKRLGNDIFLYYGLGCRNVSKLFVPVGYDFNKFYEGIFSFKGVLENNKYANNYEYNRTIYLMNGEKILDNNFLILREDISLHSPVGVLYYEYYSSEEKLRERLRMDMPHIQCIVSGMSLPGAIPFGTSQQPALGDYADRVDTLEFLLSLRK